MPNTVMLYIPTTVTRCYGCDWHVSSRTICQVNFLVLIFLLCLVSGDHHVKPEEASTSIRPSRNNVLSHTTNRHHSGSSRGKVPKSAKSRKTHHAICCLLPLIKYSSVWYFFFKLVEFSRRVYVEKLDWSATQRNDLISRVHAFILK